jgi:geranylgeranyl pyrophosphate synthase
VDRELDALLPGAHDSDRVAQCMRYAVFGGAQRVRPMLSLRTARLLRAETPAVLRAAAATELIHCASLIIDDLPCMDNASTRRGRPSAHAQFGESIAVLSAFALVALAARSTMDPIAANGSAAGLAKFQWALLGVLDPGSLIRGQALDLTDLKTVPLFELAVEAGGVSSREYDRLEDPLRKFARQYGFAFQVTDDYLDGDLHDVNGALGEIEVARDYAESFGARGRELVEIVDYLHAKITQDRRHR